METTPPVGSPERGTLIPGKTQPPRPRPRATLGGCLRLVPGARSWSATRHSPAGRSRPLPSSGTDAHTTPLRSTGRRGVRFSVRLAGPVPTPGDLMLDPLNHAGLSARNGLTVEDVRPMLEVLRLPPTLGEEFPCV